MQLRKDLFMWCQQWANFTQRHGTTVFFLHLVTITEKPSKVFYPSFHSLFLFFNHLTTVIYTFPISCFSLFFVTLFQNLLWFSWKCFCKVLRSSTHLSFCAFLTTLLACRYLSLASAATMLNTLPSCSSLLHSPCRGH